MTPKCFFYDGPIDPDGTVTLTGAAAHHLVTVMRLKSGDEAELRDGRGRARRAVIRSTSGKNVELEVGEPFDPGGESPLTLTLALAYSKSDRMDQAVRQGTQLGVHRFVVFRSERSQYRLDAEQTAKRRERWEKIAQEALCQCCRARLPEFLFFPDVAALLESAARFDRHRPDGLKILAYEGEEQGSLMALHNRYPQCRDLFLAIGPEGGLEPSEADAFAAAGFHRVQLGPRILRLETAAVTLAAAAQLLWGDLSAPAVFFGSGA
jgi:16S rRNA (uracil1498-N3)-methyltransferase